MKKEKTGLRPIDKPVYGYWQALYLSFFSSRLYVDVGKRWRGFGFIYLLLVITVCSIPLAVSVMIYFNRSITQQVIEPMEKIPTLYIQNGEVQFNKPMPYFIKNSKGSVQGIIDTTGVITSMKSEYPDLTILITKNKIFFRAPKPPVFYPFSNPKIEDQILVQELDKSMNQVFNGKDFVDPSGVKALKYFSQALVLPLLISFFYSMYFIFLPVLAFLGQVFSQVFFSFKPTFKQSCRLIMVSATPMLVLSFIVLGLKIISLATNIILMILLSAYFSFALMSLKKESQEVIHK